ncbi:MAG: sensor histidine kinase [Spirochaetaceae bacterium]
MKNFFKRLRILNLLVPLFLLLVLVGYISVSVYISQSILKNQRAVLELQVAYYRLDAFINAPSAAAKESLADYSLFLTAYRKDFHEAVSSFTERPFFREMRKTEPLVDSFFRRLLHISDVYALDAPVGVHNPLHFEVERVFEQSLNDMSIYIHNYTDRQLAILWKMSFFAGIMFVVFTVFLFYLLLQNRHAALLEKRIRAMGRAYIRSLELTKKNIAYDIHDTVIQELGSARVRLQRALDNAPHKNKDAEGVLESLAFSIDKLREIINGIQQWDMRVYTLKQALRHLIDEMSKSETFSLTLKTAGLQGIEIPEDHKSQILAIVYEALGNVKKHAEAKNVVVSAAAAGSRLEIRIRDDGKGFKEETLRRESKTGHIGMISMEERARIIGGKFAVRSSLKKGTVVRLTVPLGSKALSP